MISVEQGFDNAINLYCMVLTDMHHHIGNIINESSYDKLFERYGIYEQQIEQAKLIAESLYNLVYLYPGQTVTNILNITIPTNLRYGSVWKMVTLNISNFVVEPLNFHSCSKNNISVNYDPTSSNLPDNVVINISGQINISNFINVMTGIICHELTHAYEDYHLGGNKIRLKLGDMYTIGLIVLSNQHLFSNKTKLFADLSYRINPEESNAYSSQLSSELLNYRTFIKNGYTATTALHNTYVYNMLKKLETKVKQLYSFTDADYQEIYNDLVKNIGNLPNGFSEHSIKDKCKEIVRSFNRLKNHIETNAGKTVAHMIGQ